MARDVLDATPGGTASARAVRLLEQARAGVETARRAESAEAPTADDATVNGAADGGPLPALCGLLGVEFSLAPLALCVARAATSRRAATRRRGR